MCLGFGAWNRLSHEQQASHVSSFLCVHLHACSFLRNALRPIYLSSLHSVSCFLSIVHCSHSASAGQLKIDINQYD